MEVGRDKGGGHLKGSGVSSPAISYQLQLEIISNVELILSTISSRGSFIYLRDNHQISPLLFAEIIPSGNQSGEQKRGQ